MRRLLLSLFAAPLMASTTSPSPPAFEGGPKIDALIEQAIRDDKLPGAVVLIGSGDRIVFERAYGNRSVVPTIEPMSLDTIFDCASLTKVVSTTTCLMRLFDEGKFRLNDPVTQYIPEFQGGHSSITIRELLTHFSGLKPDVPISPPWSGYDHGVQLACTDPPQTEPGRMHIYSDINFELLGELVHRLSGQTLDDYAKQHVFEPLGMRDTTYNPATELRSRIAPTEQMPGDAAPLRGVVHDPTARYMGGVAGHAGVFSTAADLSRFARMMLHEGILDGHRLASAATVHKFTEPQTPPNQPVLRGLGWDIDSPFSGNRGELFPIGSYGHTGFTGTSLWIDPKSQSYVILLANAVHPHLRPAITALRSQVATAAAASLGIRSQGVSLTGYNELFLGPGFRRPVYRIGATKTGLDVLEAEQFKRLRNLRVGLVTNQSGLDAAGHRNVDVMRAAGIQVVRLFSPEHGFAGALDHEGIGDATDSSTGLPIVSLYGQHLKPTAESLAGLDALVFDIQDAGVRFYTFESTLAYCIDAAGAAKLKVFVLDRPNPLTGVRVEGPGLDPDNVSFVGVLPNCPVRHGMTMGELALMFNAERHSGAAIEVVKMEDWERGDWFDATGVPWVNPSPNLRSLKACLLYPGLCLCEFPDNLSVGRGTDSPFEQVGAEFVNGRDLAKELNRREIPGLRFYPTSFTPADSKLAARRLEGVRIEIVDREQLNSVRLGVEVACALQKLYPGRIDWAGGKRLIGHNATIRAIQIGTDPLQIMETWREELSAFGQRRSRYLLYRTQ